MATQSWVNREYRRGLRTHPCGAPVLRVSKVGMFFPTFPTWGAARQKVPDCITQGGVETLGLQHDDELGRYYVVEC